MLACRLSPVLGPRCIGPGIFVRWLLPATWNSGYWWRCQSGHIRPWFILPMNSSGISFGQTTVHSPWLVQPGLSTKSLRPLSPPPRTLLPFKASTALLIDSGSASKLWMCTLRVDWLRQTRHRPLKHVQFAVSASPDVMSI
jgi:hypothetical protein